VTQIALGEYHTYALRSDGSVVGWGSNDNGRSTTPQGMSNVTQISCGYGNTCVVRKPISIFGVRPVSGPAEGGTSVSITGSNFPPNPLVTFNGIAATNVVVVSSSMITAVTPSSVPGEAVVAIDYGSAPTFYYRPYCGSDLDQNGAVDGGDLAILLLDYGQCYVTATSRQSDDSALFMLQEQSAAAAPRSR
jgi:hypothetical protein